MAKMTPPPTGAPSAALAGGRIPEEVVSAMSAQNLRGEPREEQP